MCYIMIVKRTGEPFQPIETQIRKTLTEKMDFNDQGFYFQNGKDTVRTLDDRIAKETIKEAELNNLLVHFRLASVGKVTEKNVHGWTLGDWTFFHNGGISTYTDWQSKGEQEFSDSYQLFQALWLKLESNKNQKDKQISHIIENHLKTINFWGRAALYNRKTDKMFLFGDFYIYCLGFRYLIFSSSFLNLDFKAEKTISGLKFEYDSPSHNGEAKIDGIWVVENFSTPEFRFKQLLDKMPERSFDHVKYDKPNQNYGENWIWKDESWMCKPKELAGPKVDIELTPEREDILENINAALSETSNKPYTEKELQNLFEDKKFFGWDEEGNELYSDSYGLHDKNGNCCFMTPQACREWNEVSAFVSKEDVMDFKKSLEEVKV